MQGSFVEGHGLMTSRTTTRPATQSSFVEGRGLMTSRTPTRPAMQGSFVEGHGFSRAVSIVSLYGKRGDIHDK